MRRFVLLGLLLLGGCQNVVGPLQCRQPIRVDDPCVSIGEQKRRGRDRLALPQDSGDAAPPLNLLPGWGNGQ
jgi:hypothetical protein